MYSELVGVKETTVWRWCREGNLPCLKVGRHWRIRREALEDFLKRSESSTTLIGQLSSFLQVPDSVLAIAQNLVILHRLDAAFFRVGEAYGGLLVKFYGGEEHSEERVACRVREERPGGREAGAGGSFPDEAEEDPLGSGRGDQLAMLLEEVGEKGRTVWASFDWVRRVDPDTALKQQESLAEIVDTQNLVVKTAALDEAIDEWPATALRRVQAAHSATIMASEAGLSLSRVTPMPPS